MYVKRILPNGVRLITERIDNMRTVSVGIWVGNGSRYEPAELGGVSHFIEHMIFKGTEKRSARHIAIAIDALGGQANAFTDKECTCYYMKVLDSRLKNAVALLADMFLHSRFAQEDHGAGARCRSRGDRHVRGLSGGCCHRQAVRELLQRLGTRPPDPRHGGNAASR